MNTRPALYFHLRRDMIHRGIALDMVNADKNAPAEIATHVEFAPVNPGASFSSGPLLTLLDAEAQQLMDALWNCGVRPTEGHGSVGQLAATERHLQDMQKLVFKTSGKQSDGK